MDRSDEFYTFKGNQTHMENALTPAMEDYLEMICRLLRQNDVVRVGELADILHVRPSSATKMIQQLKLLGYVDSEKYGYVTLTDKGRETGEYLLYRHAVLCRFLCVLNCSSDELEQTEKIEHFLDRKTIENLAELTKRLEYDSSQ